MFTKYVYQTPLTAGSMPRPALQLPPPPFVRPLIPLPRQHVHVVCPDPPRAMRAPVRRRETISTPPHGHPIETFLLAAPAPPAILRSGTYYRGTSLMRNSHPPRTTIGP